MPVFYRKEVGDDGVETMVEVQEDDIVKSSEAFTKTAEALKKANKEAQKLRLEQKKGDPSDDNNESGTPAPAVPQAPIIDEDALYQSFRNRLTAEEKAAQEAEDTRKAGLQALATKFKLKNDVLPLLEDSKNPERLAETLAKTNYRFDDSAQGEDDPKATFDRQIKEIGGLIGLDGTEPNILQR